jgi:hypothetical protein
MGAIVRSGSSLSGSCSDLKPSDGYSYVGDSYSVRCDAAGACTAELDDCTKVLYGASSPQPAAVALTHAGGSQRR